MVHVLFEAGFMVEQPNPYPKGVLPIKPSPGPRSRELSYRWWEKGWGNIDL